MNIFADNDQILILVCASEILGTFMVAMNVANFQLFASYRTFAKLSAVQRDAVVIVSSRTIWDWISHEVVHNAFINVSAQ